LKTYVEEINQQGVNIILSLKSLFTFYQRSSFILLMVTYFAFVKVLGIFLRFRLCFG